MSSFSIGITGLNVAQSAIDLIGTNMANATTDGYHKQSPVIASLDFSNGTRVSGGGVEITAVLRSVDRLLEMEINRQQTGAAQTGEELESLQTIESAFGDMNSSRLDTAIGTFFESLRQLAAQPSSQPLQQQVVWDGDAMTQQFHTLSGFLSDLEQGAQAKLPDLVAQANDLAQRVADMNQQLNRLTMEGSSSNLLLDHRDQAIQDLAKLGDVQVVHRTGETAIDVIAWGVPLVSGSIAWPLSSGVKDNQLYVKFDSSSTIVQDKPGGQIGGLLAVHNSIVSGLRDKLDSVCRSIMSQINEQHAQGANADGPFSELTGTALTSGTLQSLNPDMTAGALYIRLSDKATGTMTRSSIDIDPATDTIASVAAKIDALDHLSASVVGGALHIRADAGYGFDFTPALSADPYQNNLGGTARATVSGTYTGSSNELFTCTVKGSGDASVGDDLSLEVTNQAGEVVATFNVGKGYAAGDPLDMGDGMRLSLSSGSLRDGDTFSVQALANTDPGGFLATAGLNSFFEGDSATTVAVRPELLSDPGLLALNTQASLTDGDNAKRMANLGDEASAALGGLNCREYVRQMITNIGQRIAGLKSRQDSSNAVLNMLQSQREDVSVVDVNEEAAKLMAFQRMYQGMAKLISTQDTMLQVLMDKIG